MEKNKGNNKLRTILVLNYLRNHTDDSNSVSLSEISDELNSHGITADRKSLYDDFNVLGKADYQIEKKYGKTVTYYLKDNSLRGENALIPSLIFLSSPFFPKQKSTGLTKAMLAHYSPESTNSIYTKLLKVIKKDDRDCIELLAEIVKSAYEETKIHIETDSFIGNVSVYYVYITENQMYLICGGGNIPDRISYFPFDAIKEYHPTTIKANSSDSYIQGFSITDYIENNIDINPERKYDIELVIHEHLILEFIEKFVSSSISEKLKTKKIDEYDFRLNMESAITTPLIEYLFKHNDHIKVISPACIKEKINRIEQFISLEK